MRAAAALRNPAIASAGRLDYRIRVSRVHVMHARSAGGLIAPMDLHIPWSVFAGIPDATDDPQRIGIEAGRRGRRMTSVMLVEDDSSFLHRFCKIVVSDPAFELFAAVGNLASARQALLHKAPDVLITDLGLPDGDGIDLIRETAQRYPATDIMVITVFGDERHVLSSIEAGATGYLLKGSLPEEIVDEIKQLVASGSPISPLIARQLLKRFSGGGLQTIQAPAVPALAVDGESDLSPRETEVLSTIAKGFSFGEIAKLLAMSPHTVTAHVKKIYQKLAVHSRGEAVYEAGRMGLLKR
jgi:DNA-binding NarL/FixJ family response regulator